MMGERRRPRPRAGGRVTAAVMLVLLISVGLLAAGCGDDDDPDASANDAYASGVCTAIGTWQQRVDQLSSTVKSADSCTSLGG